MKIAIYGYGNLGRGVERAIAKNPDMTLSAVFTRRDPAGLKIATEGVPVVAAGEMERWKDKVDVMILCGGSATDLPEMTPALAAHFHVVDSYDNHSSIPRHYKNVDEAANRYSMQIASRLYGEFKRLTFLGSDIRILKSRG